MSEQQTAFQRLWTANLDEWLAREKGDLHADELCRRTFGCTRARLFAPKHGTKPGRKLLETAIIAWGMSPPSANEMRRAWEADAPPS